MKLGISTLLIISCLIFAPFFLKCRISVYAQSRDIYVDDDNVLGPWDGTPENPYKNITSALENAIDGDTIFVREGIYVENLFVDKSVSLVGENVDTTIVDGSGTGSVISIVADELNVTGFTIKRSGTDAPDSAINITHSSNVVISYNKIIENTNGISLYSSSNNTFMNNVISSNSFYGVYFGSSSSNIVSGNVIIDNYYGGVYFFSCSNNVVSDNTISLTIYGVYFYSCSGNVVSGNTILSNNYGVYLTYSANNTFYHNNFNNVIQVSADSENIWSYGGEGNYFSVYNGADLNEDGIGDTPFVIDEKNQDYNPLIGRFSVFTVTYKGKTYRFDVISNSTIPRLILEIGAETGNKILKFNATGEIGTIGFCRIWIPTELMKYPHIVLIDAEEANQTLLGVSNATYSCLYFAYSHKNYTISIISSEALHLYYELLSNYVSLNLTYYELLNIYNSLLESYTQLQQDFEALNASYQQLLNLNVTYYELLDTYLSLNHTYDLLVNIYNALLGNYTQLQERVLDSEQVQNIRSLSYIIAALSAAYIITTVYLSKRVHTKATIKTKVSEEEK